MLGVGVLEECVVAAMCVVVVGVEIVVVVEMVGDGNLPCRRFKIFSFNSNSRLDLVAVYPSCKDMAIYCIVAGSIALIVGPWPPPIQDNNGAALCLGLRYSAAKRKVALKNLGVQKAKSTIFKV